MSQWTSTKETFDFLIIKFDFTVQISFIAFRNVLRIFFVELVVLGHIILIVYQCIIWLLLSEAKFATEFALPFMSEIDIYYKCHDCREVVGNACGYIGCYPFAAFIKNKKFTLLTTVPSRRCKNVCSCL